MFRARLRRLAVSALVALVLVGAPVPGAVAQAAPRPQPGELWRQFPLETDSANEDGRANARPTPRVAGETSGTPEDQAGGSAVTVQTVVIVLEVALLLILVIGALVYVQGGRFDRPAGRRTLRRATGAAAAASETALGAIARLHTRIVSETAALKTQLRAPLSTGKRTPGNAPGVGRSAGDGPPHADAPSSARGPTMAAEAPVAGTLKGRLDLYLNSMESRASAHAKPGEPKAEPGPSIDLPRSPADDELEILKAKLGKAAAPVEDSRAEEVETLKAKLDAARAGTDGVTTGNELNSKLADPATPPGRVPSDTDVDSLKAKLEVRDREVDGDAAASVDLGAHAASLDEPQSERAVDRAPVPPNEESAASARSRATASGPLRLTVLPSRRSTGKASRSRRKDKQWFSLELKGREARRRPEAPGGNGDDLG